MVLETARCYLRELLSSDFTALCRILQDETVMYAYEHAFDDQEVQDWLDRQRTRYQTDGFGLWAVILKESGEMIGQCGLTMQEFHHKRVIEVGYLFQKSVWHRGYASETALACQSYAFTHLQAEEVFSLIRDTNLASQRVAMRNGMTIKDRFVKQYHGVTMPHLVFSIQRTAAAR